MSSGPIVKIPQVARTSSEPFNRLLNEHRDALIALRDRYQPRPKNRPGGSPKKPFAISVKDAGADWTAKVGEGIVSFPTVYRTSAGYARIVVEKARITATELTGLADDTTYGIWMETSSAFPGSADPLQYGLNDLSNESLWGAAGNSGTEYIGAGLMLIAMTTSFSAYAKDSTHTEAADVPDYVYATDDGAIFIGQVAIASGVVTIDQWVEENIQIPALTWTHGTISTGSANSITSDGGAAFANIPPTVSTDAGNDISAGADGGAFYETP